MILNVFENYHCDSESYSVFYLLLSLLLLLLYIYYYYITYYTSITLYI